MASANNPKRWTDTEPAFSRSLNYIKDMPKEKQEKTLLLIKEKIEAFDPELMDRHLDEFPLKLRRRWYDRDPLCWVVINSLKYTSEDFRKEVADLVFHEMGFTFS